jgi:hypothetical protein
MGRLRILSALTVGLLLGLVAITILGGVAFGAIVGLRIQAEDPRMTLSSTTQITIQSDPDGSGPAGSNLRWEAGSGTSVRASITITPGQQVNQIQTFVRQVGTNDAFAFYVDGVKVGTVTPPSGGAWGLRTIDLASPIAAGSHQLQIGPNATLANRANVDWFELHNTGSTDTTPPETTITPGSGPAEGSTDTDGSVSFSFSGTDASPGSVTRFECSLVAQGQLPSWSTCTSPRSYTGLANGSYTFSVRAIDAANNVDASPATRNFSVSTPLPPPQPSGFNPGFGKGSAADCTRTLSAGGNVETFINSLNPGERGCLRGGLYTADNSISVNVSGTSASPIILAAYPGERAEIRASFRANSTSNVELEGLYIDASYAPLTFENNRINTEQTVSLMSSSSWLLDSVELVNRRTPNDRDNAGTCVFGGTSRNALFTHSWVHRCGELPRTNREHGIYVANSTEMTIEHSWFSDIADRAISHHSNVVGSQVNGVVIDSHNGAPAISYTTAQNTLVENSVLSSASPEIRYNGGSGNVVRNVCAATWETGSGISFQDMVSATPTFSGFKVTGPPACVAKLPSDSPFRP